MRHSIGMLEASINSDSMTLKNTYDDRDASRAVAALTRQLAVYRRAASSTSATVVTTVCARCCRAAAGPRSSATTASTARRFVKHSRFAWLARGWCRTAGAGGTSTQCRTACETALTSELWLPNVSARPYATTLPPPPAARPFPFAYRFPPGVG
jgi:hypothetical protein